MTREVSKTLSLSASDLVHFIGIGGSGMSALAELACRRGYPVQGSDIKTSIVTERLVKLGIPITIGHSAAAIGNASLVVCSSAIDRGNVELVEANRLGLKVIHRSEMLAHLIQAKTAITVAGTHGKSTTSAMIVHTLATLGLDPDAILGGALRQYQSSARYGQGQIIVAEADESDGTFVRYAPQIGVVTNIDLDHMEFYKDAANLQSAFHTYLSNIDPDGAAIVGWDSPMLRDVSRDIRVPRFAYGFLLGADIRATSYNCTQGESTFTAIVERDHIFCRIPTIGKHNIQNALATLAVTRALSLKTTAAADALASFPGVERRMNLIYKNERIAIFDDYAHNPGKIAASITALKESFPGWQLQVVYQPHRYSRLETMYDDMLRAVINADIVHVLPVYSAGEISSGDFSPEKLARDIIKNFNVPSFACENFESATDSVLYRLKHPTVILTVGAGDVWKVAKKIERQIE